MGLAAAQQPGWSGLAELVGVATEVACSRSTGTLAGSAQRLLHSFLKVDGECQSAQETVVVTVIEASGGVARRSGDRGGGGIEGHRWCGKG
jgi:hypothetical protein